MDALIEAIRYGLSWKAKLRVAQWFDEFFSNYCDIIPINQTIAERAGLLPGQLQTKGDTRTQFDMLLSATASIGNSTLVTRNVHHFSECGIALLNPFTK